MLNRIIYHVKNGTLFTATYRVLQGYLKSKKDVPIGDTYHGEKAAIYDQHRENDQYWKKENECVREYISNIAQEVKVVIDAPYGTGRFAPIYHKFGLQVLALDISNSMVEVAKEKHQQFISNTTFLIQDLTKIPYPDNSIDLGVCFRFIPWIISFEEAEVAMAELGRVCSKYAIIELCVGTHKSSSDKIPSIRRDKILWDKFNKDQLTEWLKTFNLEVLSTKFLYNDEEHPGLTAFFCKKVSK